MLNLIKLIMKLILDIIKGNLSLAKTFWLVSFFGNMIPYILVEFNRQKENIIIYFIFYVSYIIYSTISVFNSSSKYIAKQKINKESGILGYISILFTIAMLYFVYESYLITFKI